MERATLRPSPDVVARRMGDEMVLVHLGTDRVCTLNSTAARLWELLDEGFDLPAVEQRLQREFVVDEHQLRDEITATVRRLTDYALLVNHDHD